MRWWESGMMWDGNAVGSGEEASSGRRAWASERQLAQRPHELRLLRRVGHRIGLEPTADGESGLQHADLLGFPGCGGLFAGRDVQRRHVDARLEIHRVA